MKFAKKSLKYSLLFLTVFCTQLTFAQKITGTVIDEDKAPLEFVSVALLQPKDSLLVSYTSTGKDGKFSLSGFKEGRYMMQIFLMTYQADQRIIDVTKEPKDFGTITLNREVNQLDEVVINAIVPIKIKQDTTAFNANAFKVKQDDNVEDLVKKLPGVQIGTDGTVTAQGEEVTKILVDGKEFFTNDPQIALKNLTADAIKSVQIIDEESDDTRTTGIKDGEKTKIMNLVLKEGKKSGYFGKMGAGIGTNDRYTSNFDLNRFTANSQLAMFGNLNNINNSGATVFQRGGGKASNKSGYLTTGTAGANYNYEFKKDYNFNIDYNFGHSDREEEEESKRTEFTNDTSFSSERESDSQDISNNHNVNFSLRDRSTEGKYVELRGSFKNDSRESDSFNSTVYYDNNDVEDTNSERTTTSEDDRDSGSLRFSYRKKINEKGRNIRVQSGLSFNDNHDMNWQNSKNKYDVSDSSLMSESNETTTRDERNKGLDYNTSFRYMEPIVAHHLVSFSSSVRNENEDETLDQNRTTNGLEDNLAYNLDYNKQVYNHQLGYVFSQDKFQLYMSGAYETMVQKLDVDNNQVIDNKYNNFLPRVYGSYEYKKGHRIRFRYSKETRLPSANEVTPIVNDFNPLYISVGNTDLTPEKSNNYFAMLGSHDFTKATSFFAMFRYTNSTNAIIVNRSIDDNYVRTSTYENYGDKSNLTAFLSYSRKIENISLRYNIRLRGGINDYTTIIDGAYNDTNSKSTNIEVSFSNENKNKVDLNIGAKFDINKTTYSLQGQDRDFFSQNYFTKFDWDITNDLTFNTQFDYTMYTDNNFDSQNIPIWNMALEYAFLKGKRGNLKFQVFDILDEDVGLVRTSTENYFEETFKKTLGTYAMVSFTYNIKPPTGRSTKRGNSGRSRYGRMH